MKKIAVLIIGVAIRVLGVAQESGRQSFNSNWKFKLDDVKEAASLSYNDAKWRSLSVPHDWSIELPFDSTSPTGTGGGALKGGLAWYRKTFTLPETDKDKIIFIDFDGVYRNSEVFINGHSLGIRPNGYISFRYDLTPYLKFGNAKNVLAVKVDNAQQPNSRWYSGSGIYRNVWLVKKQKSYIDKWGVFYTTPSVDKKSALLNVTTNLTGEIVATGTIIKNTLFDKSNKQVATTTEKLTEAVNQSALTITNPHLWNIDAPYLYKLVTQLVYKGKVIDQVTTPVGLRSFEFTAQQGFILNGKKTKIIGVCNHHDLGCLGTAVNTSALRRQLTILKGMGVNGIRSSHNPPAPELLDLADEMGFIVMDEAFDMWKKSKTKFDYSLDWDKWYKQDMEDMVKRDRNHPSVFMWSVGNEIGEQWGDEAKGDTAGRVILKELVQIVKSLDHSRPTITGNNEPRSGNNLLKANATELIGYNYNHPLWDSVQLQWGNKPFIVTESVSALQTRGSYDMPSDSIRRWPSRWDLPVQNANDDLSCSAYDNCSAPWGSTHEETLKELLKYDHISGMYVWTGFDYIGEPTPYPWPARSSYFGIVDLAGFPKDVYYLYQSLFTTKKVLHLFPHWNWKAGQTIDLWAYYNQADEVELFVNGKSQGVRKKTGDQMHVMWRVKFEAGKLKAVSRKKGQVVMVKEINTAGTPAKIVLEADKKSIQSGNDELAFIKVKITDKEGNLIPDADNLVQFTITGGSIAGVDNGSPTSMESFKETKRKAFNGLCLAMIRSKGKPGMMTVQATAAGLTAASISIMVK